MVREKGGGGLALCGVWVRGVGGWLYDSGGEGGKHGVMEGRGKARGRGHKGEGGRG
jgi:hypothetical protein